VKDNITLFFYVLYSNKTWVFGQSECAQSTIYITMYRNFSSRGYGNNSYISNAFDVCRYYKCDLKERGKNM